MRAYRRVLRNASSTVGPDAPAVLALPTARAIGCAGELITAHLLARQRVGEELWQRLHTLYATAEERGIAQTGTGDPDLHETCTDIYVQPLLFALAQSHGMPQRDMLWTRDWIRRFPHKVQVASTTDKLHSHTVDLFGRDGPVWLATDTAAQAPDKVIRFLDTTALGHSLRKRGRRLKDGDAPAVLGLGRDCSQPGAGELLRALVRAWCAAPPAPKFPRV